MHLEALARKSKTLFQKLPAFSEFYLVGGTALALQIGHRISVDFDLFSAKPLKKTLFEKIRRVFPQEQKRVIANSPEQLSVLIAGTKIDFVHYPFPVILPFVQFAGLKLMAVPEIAATKAYTLGRRPLLRDYVDLYFIIKGRYVALPKIIELAQKKYKSEFDPRLFLEQLIYLEDVEDTPIEFLKKRVSRKELHRFFEGRVKKIRL